MVEIVKIKCGPRAPDDLPDTLRNLAKLVEDGNIVSMVMGYVEDGEYKTLYASSMTEALTLASLMYHSTLHKLGGV